MDKVWIIAIIIVAGFKKQKGRNMKDQEDINDDDIEKEEQVIKHNIHQE